MTDRERSDSERRGSRRLVGPKEWHGASGSESLAQNTPEGLFANSDTKDEFVHIPNHIDTNSHCIASSNPYQTFDQFSFIDNENNHFDSSLTSPHSQAQQIQTSGSDPAEVYSSKLLSQQGSFYNTELPNFSFDTSYEIPPYPTFQFGSPQSSTLQPHSDHKSGTKRQRSASDTTSASPRRHKAPRSPKTYHSRQLSLEQVSGGAGRVLESWVTNMFQPSGQYEPSSEDVSALSHLTKSSPHVINQWLNKRLQGAPQMSPNFGNQMVPVLRSNSTPPERSIAAFSAGPRQPTEQDLVDIQAYIDESSEKCKKPDGRRPENAPYFYHCTQNCGYRSKTKHDWRRHEENRQPQTFYMCILCREEKRKKIFICQRDDKIRQHVRGTHKREDDVRPSEDSRMDYQAPFEDTCSYSDCPARFRDWEHRLQHYVAEHFHLESPGSQPPPENRGNVAIEHNNQASSGDPTSPEGPGNSDAYFNTQTNNLEFGPGWFS